MYDIAIVGAGPAGATLARLIGGKGLKVALIDSQTKKSKKPCGGLLAPDAQKILARFDLVLPKDVLVDPQIFSVKTIDVNSGSIKYYPRHYLNLDRYKFDRWLVSLITDDVEVVPGECRDILRTQDGFRLKIHSDGESWINARRIVGADGANSVVRKKLFKSDIMYYTAIQQWFPRSDEVNPFYSCIFDPKTSESCSWSIFKDDYFIFGGCFLPKGCQEAFGEQKRRLEQRVGFKFGKPVKTEACRVLRPRKPRDFTLGSGGAFLIGEAAGFISPSSFEGFSSAFLSGSLLAAAFLKGTTDKEILSSYRKSTRSLRFKLLLKSAKRWFMYTPISRRIIMKTGFGSITPH